MKHQYPIALVILLFISLVSLTAHSQTSDCLREARALYDNGQLLDIPDKLTQCLDDKSISIREERIQAYKLLTNVYIYLDEMREARNSILTLLKIDQRHQPTASDPAEFVYLFNKYSSTPVWAVGLYAGSTFSNVSVKEEYLLANINQASPEYSQQPAIQLGLLAERTFGESIQLGVGLRYAQKAYGYTSALTTLGTPISGGDGNNTRFNTISFVEQRVELNLPVYLKYTHQLGQFAPYAYAGFETQYLLSAELSDLARDGGGQVAGSSSPPLTIFRSSGQIGSNEIAKDQMLREQYNFSVFAGVGLKYRVSRINYLFVDFQYNHGLTNIVNQAARYENFLPELQNEFLYVDSDLSLNSLMISVGYIKSFYKTKNLEGKRPARQPKNRKKS